jgi:hypothetical protein
MSIENAINNLAEAINNLAAAGGPLPTQLNQAVSAETEKKAPAKKEAAPQGPFYWENTESGEHGEVATVEELREATSADDSVQEIPRSRFEKLQADTAKAEAAKKKAPAKKAPAKKPAAKKEEAAVSVDDLVAMAKKILPADLNAEERKERHEQIKPKLEELGAAKITAIPEESRGEMLAFLSELYDSLNSADSEGDDDLV